jgi:HlyD family secretion protein
MTRAQRAGRGLAAAADSKGSDKVVALPARKPVVSEFQPDAIEIEERQPPRLARTTLYAVIAFVACAVLWAALSEVDRIVVANGKLVTTKPNLLVQPLETSVIRTINVVPGDVVRAGATLATLDPTFTQADVDQLRARVASYAAEIDRLDAEIAGRRYVPPPDANVDEALQAAVHGQRIAAFRAQARAFDEQIASINAAMATNLSDQRSLTARLDVIREIEGMRVELMQREVGSRLSTLEARHARLDLEGQLEHLRPSYVERQHELERVRAERQRFIEAFRQDTLEERVALRADYQAAAEELAKASLRRHMIALTAPVDAVVLEVAPRSVGSVVREAEPLVTLVPLDVALEAEVALEARDIGFVVQNQRARIKIEAFPFQKHGTATGLVRTISEDAFADEVTERPFYRARVRLVDTQLRDVPETYRLLPGMTVAAEIDVGDRTVLSYFLYPLLRGLDESVREP